MQRAVIIQHDWDGKVWHLTSMVNLVQILGLQQGLLAKQQLEQGGHRYQDISMEGVQLRRQLRRIFDRPLHQYVPLFFQQRNPMMYYLKEHAAELVWLEIDAYALPKQSLVTANGNAACDNTQFCLGLAPDFLDWNVLHASSWHDIADGKRKRAAELLCLSHVPAAAIVALHVSGLQQKRDLLGYGIPVSVNPLVFFG